MRKPKLKYHKTLDYTTCAECKKDLKPSDSFQSKRHFIKGGMFACLVCSKCHEKEATAETLGKEKE